MDSLRNLKQLTEMVLDLELDRLKRLSGAQEANESALADLADQGAHLSRHFKEQTGPAAVRSWERSHLWQDRLRLEKTDLLLKAARIAARREAQLARARHALGRVRALDTLTGKALDAARARRANRQSDL